MHEDVLANVLKVGQFASKVVCNPTLSMEWGLNFPPEPLAMFHIVTKGTCWVKAGPDAEPFKLIQGDIAFLSRVDHQLLSSPEVPTVHYSDGVRKAMRMVEDGTCDLNDSTTLLCGMYKMEEDILKRFFSLLPPLIHINADHVNQDSGLQQVLSLIKSEQASSAVGSSIMLESLINMLLVCITRVWVNNTENKQSGWIFALKDPKIGKVINLMHQAPEQKWTVDSLAKAVFMSRASFAKKFVQFVGESPMIHLTKWRMDYSAHLLRTSNLPISEVALSSGYDSETSFSKVFKKYRNLPPNTYRLQHKAAQA